MKREHSTLAPSSGDRHDACPGSIALESMCPEPEPTEESIEGDDAHSVAERWAESYEWIDAKELQGKIITQEMKDGAELYAGVCNSTKPDLRYFEISVRCPRIHEEMYGTPDYFEWRAASNTVRIVDYKFGHMYVEVFENRQLLRYASGVCTQLNIKPEEVSKFEFVVVQPRWYGKEGNVRTWEMPGHELPAWEALFSQTSIEGLSGSPRTMTGGHCEFCQARATCVALQRNAASILDYTLQADVMLSTPEQIGAELTIIKKAAKILDARATGLSQQAEALLKKGNRVPGFHLERKEGRRKWNSALNKDELIAVGELLGIQLRKPNELITPAQAEDLGLTAELLNRYSQRYPSLTLEQDNNTQLRKVFGAKK